MAACLLCGTAALTFGSLLLPPVSVHAATRSNHAHHIAAQSAGKAPAHAIHDTGLRTAHAPARSAGRGAPPLRHTAGADRSTAKPRHGAPSAKHAKSTGKDQASDRRTAKAHSGHKRHRQEPIDDPQPMYRAQASHRTTRQQEALATNRPAFRTHTMTPPERLEAAPRAALPAQGTPGNVARNNARRAAKAGKQTGDPAPQTSRSGAAPDGSGFARDAQHAASSTDAKAFQSAVASLPLAAVTAPSDPSVSPSATVVQGFGAEVDFRTPPGKPGIAMPRESPAEQVRTLREAADIASKPMFVPLYARDGKLIVPPPLKGSRDILVHQNQMADDAGLARIQDDSDLTRMRRARLLVDFPENASLRVNENLPESRRCARPWTVQFAMDTARAFYARFGEALQVNSAVRTVAYQQHLQRINGNAAAVDGEGASPHLTGQALDFGKRGMSKAEVAWMRSYLLPLIDAGKIDVEEEFQQACFHVSVYAGYAATPRAHGTPRTEVAQVTRPTHAHAIAPGADDDMR